MDKITTKTKILLWGVVGEKEKIDFDLCDFSPEQVGDLDRLLRADGEAKVRLTIEPEQKKLQIAPIISAVRLVSLSCRTKGQKIKVADFKSPDERATAIKRMCAADTPVELCIEEIDGQLFGNKPTAKDANHSKGKINVGPGLRAESEKQIIPLKFKGLRGCFCQITVVHDDQGWRAGYEIKVGNLEKSMLPADQIARGSRAEAIEVAKSSIQQWAEEVEVGGSADAKRAMMRRLTSVCEQIDEQLDPLIDQAELEEDDREAEEFAEDEPK